jgi:Meckel syndrome type 1 protein
MAYPRSTTRFLTSTAILIAGAAPALAAERPKADDALRVTAPTAPAALAAAQERLEREERRVIAARKARRNPGPFVPVVGKVDYGTAENAFGAARSGHIHAGHDMFAPAGTPLVAVDDAVVVDAGSDGGQGNYVHLYDPKHNRTYVYMHMIEPTNLKAGQEVKAGEQVGGLGCTGSCSGDHLHFEIRDGKSMAAEAHDPLPELKSWESLDKPL